MLRTLATIALLGCEAYASYDGNLNYRSPSSEHPSLGIDVAKVTKRHLAKRQEAELDPASLNYTHGVASVSRKHCYGRPATDHVG
jgi:alkaline phosphatase D